MNSPLKSNTDYIEHFSMGHCAYNLVLYFLFIYLIHISIHVDTLHCKILLKQCAEIQN